MNKAVLLLVTAFLSWVVPASAHRLDEYLQATIISVEKDRVHVSMRLVPGIAVTPAVLAAIDTNGDGFISQSEKWTYAGRVLDDLTLSVDGHPLRLRLVSMEFPEVKAMYQGLGEIRIEFAASLPRGGSNRSLVFENHHDSYIAAYLVNCLVPRDPNLHIVAQKRNVRQSFYELDYVQSRARLSPE
jgi:hypothetical protein